MWNMSWIPGWENDNISSPEAEADEQPRGELYIRILAVIYFKAFLLFRTDKYHEQQKTIKA